MVIRIRDKGVLIMTDDEREFVMDYVQMEQIRLAIEIIEDIKASVEIDTFRLETKGDTIIYQKEDNSA